MKKYVKLLKGKGIRSDLVFCDYRSFLGRALALHWASIGSSGKIIAWERGSASVECYSPQLMLPTWTEDCGFGLGCWRNDLIPPVLKHGPRSLTSMQVFGCKTRTRNESERR